ncbi:MAG: 30S ribosomal protein S17 [Candidatus Abawacabacteria bacterium]|nr:30S ribosomal protein S17 [Candidatus Abawacabacteria bacterium]
MRFKTGVVVGTKMAKTVTVLVDRLKAHPKYKKQYKVSTKFYAHNEDATIKVGDLVTIVETRPLSKLKRWRVISEKEQKILLKESEKQLKEQNKKDAQHVSQKKEFLLPYKKRTKKAKSEAAPAPVPASESSPAS